MKQDRTQKNYSWFIKLFTLFHSDLFSVLFWDFFCFMSLSISSFDQLLYSNFKTALIILELLTVMRGDDVGDIDVSIAGFSPHAARGGARISIPLILIFISNVINDKGLLCCVHCEMRALSDLMIYQCMVKYIKVLLCKWAKYLLALRRQY